MRVQHNSPDPPDQEHDSFAALRQDFTKTAVRNGLKGRNPNWPFAVGVFNVSVSVEDFATVRAAHGNDRSQPKTTLWLGGIVLCV